MDTSASRYFFMEIKTFTPLVLTHRPANLTILPIRSLCERSSSLDAGRNSTAVYAIRSEEHTSELQSRQYLPSSPTRRSSDLLTHRPANLTILPIRSLCERSSSLDAGRNSTAVYAI